ncbi:MAG: AAA family ATPase [Pseudomonadota bacterium]
MQRETWQELGLERDPFPTDGPDDLYLQTSGLNQRLSLCAQLVQSSDLTVLLLGETGAGKSMFLQRLAGQFSEDWLVVSWHAFTGAAPGDLLQVLTAGFAMTPGDAGVDLTFESFREHMAALRGAGQSALLLVDDAERLGEDELQFVLDLAGSSELRLVLAGTDALSTRVGKTQPGGGDAELVHRIAMAELTQAQTIDYLRARLMRSGWQEESPFTDEVCEQIFVESDGNPGRIHAAAAQFLQSGGETPVAPGSSAPGGTPRLETVSIDPDAVRARLTTHAPIQPRITLHQPPRGPSLQTIGYAALSLLLVGGLAYALFSLGDGADEPDSLPQPAPVAIPELTPAPAPESGYPELNRAPPPPPPAVLADTGEAAPSGPVDLNAPVAGQPEAGPAGEASAVGEPGSGLSDEDATPETTPGTAMPRPRPKPGAFVTPEQVAAEEAAARAEAAAEAATERTTDTAGDATGDPIAALASSLASEAERDTAETTGVSAVLGALPRPRFPARRRRGDVDLPSSAPIPAPTPAVASAPTPAPASTPAVIIEERSIPSTAQPADAAGSDDPTRPDPAAPLPANNWLTRANPDQYTLQLIVLGSEASADAFARRHQVGNALVVTLRTPNGKPLFAVAQGVFEARDTALAAVRRLPPDVRRENPWPRRVGSLVGAALDVRQVRP